ncbi:type II toxin-antitoxin system RelE/ParE family toxin [Mucilaginibacter terrigena]|uniref:Type II toxin-antitoxin system RelE/ParE family toxin n=1 Tax=Mucilaginibacter terrigena TaxID=2492395 RepID=A0A4Q5LJN5_9SPHI|nr:type II toxin-antitoxin system RelE/ParE family toxin [Mucilaginibacter terrigena]RYU87252.1 type II toxin-antitoxin system RelE/ParE family toxin [Mucilaginibacter terrigena]
MKYFILKLEEATNFLQNVESSTKLKFTKVFRKVQEGHNTAEDFKKLPGTNSLFEFRVKDKGMWFRILAFLTHFEGDMYATIVATHGFKKKTNKIPRSEIDKADYTKKDY